MSNKLKNILLKQIETEHNLSKIKNNCYKLGFDYYEIDLELQNLINKKEIVILSNKVYLTCELN